MACIAIVAHIKPPIFSLKNPEAFQIASSLPIPQPSAMIGTLAYCIAISQRMGSSEALRKASQLVVCARSTIKEESISAPSPIILWRFRILDRGFEKPKEKGKKTTLYEDLRAHIARGDISAAKSHLEFKLKDALYREYIFTESIIGVWVLNKEIDANILRFITRIGDTESYCSVSHVEKKECSIRKVNEVETRFPAPYDPNAEVSGDFIIISMCDEKRRLRRYVLPMKRELVTTSRGSRILVYRPTVIKIKFPKPVDVAEFDGEKIVVGI